MESKESSIDAAELCKITKKVMNQRLEEKNKKVLDQYYRVVEACHDSAIKGKDYYILSMAEPGVETILKDHGFTVLYKDGMRDWCITWMDKDYIEEHKMYQNAIPIERTDR